MSRAPIHVLYATVSGNAEELARETARILGEAGEPAVVANLAERTLADLDGVATGLFIVSTWGDGEPPPEAANFFAELAAESEPRWRGRDYAVLALGSSRYAEFCRCGRQLDEDLGRLGGRRLLPRVECDVKYAATFRAWMDQLLGVLQKR